MIILSCYYTPILNLISANQCPYGWGHIQHSHPFVPWPLSKKISFMLFHPSTQSVTFFSWSNLLHLQSFLWPQSPIILVLLFLYLHYSGYSNLSGTPGHGSLFLFPIIRLLLFSCPSLSSLDSMVHQFSDSFFSIL